MSGSFSGRTLGHFRILEPLGSGGMGEVYRAHDLKLDRTVALKFIRPDLLGDPAMLRRFEGEARALAALDHPYVGTVHGLEEHEGHSFIVLAFVEGRPLDQILREGPLEPERAAVLLPRIAEGLAAAHAQGVVHRDVKGANILVDANNIPRLVDFGLALRAEDTRGLRDGESAVGTVAFMAPEVVRGEPADARSDQFSLGVVLYQALTGRLPFPGANYGAILHAILEDEPPPFPASLPPPILRLEPIVRHCLQKDPGRRYRDVATLAAALRQEDATVSLGPVRRAAGLRMRWSVAVAAALALAALGYGSYRWLSPRRPAGEAIRSTRSIAVLDFENLSGDPSLDWMGRGIAELLGSALSRSEELDVFDAQRLANLTRSRQEGQAAAMADLHRAGIGRAVVGSILRSGTRLRIQGRVVDAANGKVLHSSAVEGTIGGDLFELAGGLVKGLQSPLEIDLLGLKTGDQWLREITTSSTEAYRRFLEGRKAFLMSRWAEAAKKYQEALALDPGFVAARIDLTGCYWDMGDRPALEASLAEARRLRSRAGRRDALQLDMIEAVIAMDADRLVRVAGELQGLYPENRFFTYLLGRGYYTSRRYADCVKVLEPLARQRYEWGWTYMLLARAHSKLGQENDARRAFELGIEVTRGNPELRNAYAQLLVAAGEEAKALVQLEEAMRSPDLAQWPEGAASLQLTLGRLQQQAGRLEAARNAYRKCLAIAAPGGEIAVEAAGRLKALGGGG